jgi:hypothetical protein
MTSRNSFQSALVLGDGFERLAAFLFEVDFNRSRQRNAILILGDLNLGDSQALRFLPQCQHPVGCKIVRLSVL